MQPSLQDLPCLSAGFLSHHGFCEDHFVGPAFEVHGVKVLPLKLFRVVGLFTFACDDVFFTEIEIGAFISGSVCKIFFVCPKTGKLASKIYFYNLSWASSGGHRLRSSPKGPIGRNERRHLQKVHRLTKSPTHNRRHELRRPVEFKDIRAELCALGKFPVGFESLERLFKDEVLAADMRKRTACREASRRPMSLTTAIEGGHPASDKKLQQLVSAWRDCPDFLALQVPQKRSQLENHACLDLNALRRSGLLEREGDWGWHLHWPLWNTDFERLTLLFRDSPTNIGLMIEFQTIQGATRYQKIEFGMRPTMRNRLFLKCPALGTLHDRLYLRDGYFGSARAQRLFGSSE